MIEQTFTRADVDTRDPQALEQAGWFRAVKTTPTLLRWIDGGFRCLTREGYIDIDDEDMGGAYVAIDAEGFPYPIAATVFDATYKRIDALTEPGEWIDAVLGDPAPAAEAPYEPTYVQLHEIVEAANADILTKGEARNAAVAILRKSRLIDDVAETAAVA